MNEIHINEISGEALEPSMLKHSLDLVFRFLPRNNGDRPAARGGFTRTASRSDVMHDHLCIDGIAYIYAFTHLVVCTVPHRSIGYVPYREPSRSIQT
ncbi:hypothetical protein AG1IA_04836 [Rhizoctonia solani AG-1 IA]|uniref:Uncharacterized protein n=1 Tax=Thanatephorus cucumeris (strain AG1-IA) TaxID=983506 RepID=L8WWG7_THACA|nr:hypothetical protein AG1IA_04836 [Rhizoctonia solani AG-1 IA]